jgi:hypothetical protein
MASIQEDKEQSKQSSPCTVMTKSAVAPAQFVTEILPDDILLGRGAPMIRNEGNARFREIVSARKKDYMSSGRHHVKNEIAKQVLDVIAHRHGRFLRKVDSPEEAIKLGVPKGMQAWVLADNDTILEKVKQALRDKDSIVDQEREQATMANQADGQVCGDLMGQERQREDSVPSMSAIGTCHTASRQVFDTIALLRQQQESRRMQMALLQQSQLGLPTLAYLNQPSMNSALLAGFNSGGPFVSSRRSAFASHPLDFASSLQSRMALQMMNRAAVERSMMSRLGLDNSNLQSPAHAGGLQLPDTRNVAALPQPQSSNNRAGLPEAQPVFEGWRADCKRESDEAISPSGDKKRPRGDTKRRPRAAEL